MSHLHACFGQTWLVLCESKLVLIYASVPSGDDPESQGEDDGYWKMEWVQDNFEWPQNEIDAQSATQP